MVRLNRDGSLDSSFHEDGVVTTDFSGNSDWSNAVAIQPDGKIVVAGVSGDARAGDDFALARYNPDGSLDGSFSKDGKQTTDVSDDGDGGGGDSANALALAPDGTIIAGGFGDRDPDDPGGARPPDFAVARYLPDGTLDASRVTEFGAALGEGISGLSLLPDGKVLAGGTVSDANVSDFALARYTSTLTEDGGFGGGDGILTSEIGTGTYESAFEMATQPDGKIVLVGEVAPSPAAVRDIAIARYDTDGVPDPSFDGDGKLALDLGPAGNSAQGVVVQPDGKIVLAGRVGDFPNSDFAVVRLEPGGGFDLSFAGDGIVTTDFGDFDYANSIARGDDGMLVVSGANGVGPVQSAFARYVGAPPETTISTGPSGFINDPTPTFEFGSNVFGASVDCRLGDAPFAPCSSPFAAGPLADGFYSFEARARDASGTLDPTPASSSFGVDTVAPDTAIVSAPSGGTTDLTPTFVFASTDPAATFECSFDGAAFASCTSPFTPAALTPGRHTFEVRAVDAAGNRDPSPAAVVDPATGKPGFEVVDRPALGKDFNLEELSGEVFVSVPGPEGRASASIAQRRGAYRSPVKGRHFVPIEQIRQIPVGSLVDTRFGKGRVTTAVDPAAKRLQSGNFAAGVFQVLQARRPRARGLTTLRLKGASFRPCRSGGGRKGTRGSVGQAIALAARRRLSKKTIRKLNASAKGNYRTQGQQSAATIRATIWVTADRCDGTLTTVKRGKVAVRDFRRKKTVIVRAGKRYLARR